MSIPGPDRQYIVFISGFQFWCVAEPLKPTMKSHQGGPVIPSSIFLGWTITIQKTAPQQKVVDKIGV